MSGGVGGEICYMNMKAISYENNYPSSAITNKILLHHSMTTQLNLNPHPPQSRGKGRGITAEKTN